MKALAEIADIYPRMTSNHDTSLFDDCFTMYGGYVNEATNFAESQGGGGSDTKDWGREKDEDEIEWIKRCLRQATRMVKQRKSTGGKTVNDQCEKSYRLLASNRIHQ